jgi:membrane fusion protein, multidrug efflux system
MKKAAASALIGAAAIALIVGLALSVRGRQADNDEKATPLKTSERKSAGVKIDRETQERIGLELQQLKSAAARTEVAIYGTLEADPSQEFALRSPVAGTLAGSGSWPAVGAEIASGSLVGTVKPQLMPMDQLTLNERLAATRSDLTAAKASTAAASAEASRLRQLNADDKNISDKALQEAEANAAAAEARVRSAEASERLISAVLQPESNAGAVQLQMRKGGQVLEVAAQPGETVEPGQLLLRVSRFDRLLARLYVPPGQNVNLSATRATIAPADHEDEVIPAERVAVAGAIDPKLQGQTLLFRLVAGMATLRPGQAVTARIPEQARSESGVLIPSSAILRFQGEVWVYVQTTPGVFARRMLSLDRPLEGGWLVTRGYTPGEQVVVSGAELLLSEEMKSQLDSDQE